MLHRCPFEIPVLVLGLFSSIITRLDAWVVERLNRKQLIVKYQTCALTLRGLLSNFVYEIGPRFI